MSDVFRMGQRAVWRLLPLLLALFAGGCANFYVDSGTKEVAAAEFKKPEQARPVQVLFEFQSKGVANGRATELLKARVMDQVKSSGLFTSISEAPAAGGALLSLTLNNVPLSDDAFSKGFVTGLTFGLAGSKVSDGYICTARYNTGTAGDAIVKQARHAIHATLGASAAPGNATKADNAEAAVTLMTRQVVSNVLNELSRDATFK
jgi:hypothetical protein